MRLQTVIFGCVLVALCCLVKHSEAVACTSLNPNLPTGCTDCSDDANANEDDCTTTTTETTTTTTTDSSATTTTTVASDTTSTTASSGSVRRRLLRRIRRLQRALLQCRRNAAYTRASLIKKIKALSATSNSFKNKFFG